MCPSGCGGPKEFKRGTFNSGQDCTAVTRILVEDSVHDEFVDLLVEAARNTTTGTGDGDDFGPLNNARHFETVKDKLSRVPEHARILTGGAPLEREGFYLPATIVDGLRQDDELVQQETFAPVLTVQTFTSEEEAVELANGVDYGLASSVWTSDHGTAMRVSRDLDFSRLGARHLSGSAVILLQCSCSRRPLVLFPPDASALKPSRLDDRGGSSQH